MLTSAKLTHKRDHNSMYNSHVIELVRSTDPFHNKNKVNTMHECITELICSFMHESPTNEVKPMYGSCIIELFCLTDQFYIRNKDNTMHKST